MSIPLGNDTDLDDSQFFNRKEELQFLTENLTLVEKGSTPTILLTGIKGVGKTVLMKKIQKNLENDFLVVYMDLSAMDKFKKSKNDSLTRVDFLKLLHDSIIKSCENSNIITLDKIELINNIPLPIHESEEDYTKFANYVMDLPQLIYENHKDDIKGILIFMDDFQNLKQLDEDINGFLWYIRSVIQEQKNIGYIFSGSMGISDELICDIAGQKGAFGGRILNYEIKTFSYDTTRNYLSERADYLEFTEDGFKRFYKCTRGILYYVNTFSRLLPPCEKLDENKIKYEFEKSLSFLLVDLTNEWNRLNKQEKSILKTLIDEPLRRIDIAENLGVTSGAIGKSLKTLLNKTLIEVDEDKYHIYDSIFKIWLKKEVEKD